ncbi:MAG: hypothetical protein KJ592_02625 [Nanoarchaeota archaeon]|nr:hypothetical protein [Nanoarchaeota archaeon]
MAINSKEIIIILIGLISSTLIAFSFSIQNLKPNNYNTIYPILFATVIIVFFIVWFLLKENTEIKKEIANQKINLKKLNEKLNI